ncbi:hypothetical protein T07_7114 [Trichinella nelsoni]|uniref:Uncharacterized protein n=1 Tax=Trichinella nelsoni TaxID=6336 RepID=A0A0V0SFP5_9BILA|nr:hypothetical protein T07_7114 [Trichinella nelsoni]
MSTLMSQPGTSGLTFLIIHLFGSYAKFLLQLFSEPTDLQSTGRSSCFTRSAPLIDTLCPGYRPTYISPSRGYDASA